MRDRDKVVQDLQAAGIVNALKGHQNRDVVAQEDPNTRRITKIWITFSDTAVLELEAGVEGGEPSLLARMHYRRDDSVPI